MISFQQPRIFPSFISDILHQDILEDYPHIKSINPKSASSPSLNPKSPATRKNDSQFLRQAHLDLQPIFQLRAIIIFQSRAMRQIGEYKLLQLIGEGSYGKVYKGMNNETKELVAVKIISHDKFSRNPQLEGYTVNEINILTELSDAQGIARYINVLKSANNYYFIYQYCNGGTLKKVIDDYKLTSEKAMPFSHALRYFGQILNAFKLLTKNKTMHRDIKPANILLHNGKIKIADFGLSKCLKSPTDVADTMVGSPLYMSPEVLKGESYTMKADIWSLGIVLFEMVYGTCPFDTRDLAKLIQIHKTQQIKYPKSNHIAVQNLLRKMLVKDPSKRIDWCNLLEYKVVDGQLIDPVTSPTKTINTLHPPLTSVKQISQKTRYNSPSFEPSSRFDKNYEIQKKPIVSTYKQLNPTINYPTKQNDEKLKQLLEAHQKVIRASQLSIDVLRQTPKQSIYLSYIVNKIIQKELNQILQNLNKLSFNTKYYSIKNENDSKVSSFKQMISGQLIELKTSLKISRQIIESMGEDTTKLELKKYRYLKSFYKSIKVNLIENQESIVMISQLVDLFSESIIVKKETYKKINKYEEIQQIEAKLNQFS